PKELWWSRRKVSLARTNDPSKSAQSASPLRSGSLHEPTALQTTRESPIRPASQAKTSPIRRYVVAPEPRGTSTTTDVYVVAPLGRDASRRPRESLTVTSPFDAARTIA